MGMDAYDFELKTSLSEYEDFVTGLASPKSMETFQSRLATAGLGLAGEGGEIADLIKKILFHGLEYTDEVRDKLIKELGDVMWYVAFAARNVVGISIQEIIDKNVEKLQARYPKGEFSVEDFMKKELAQKEKSCPQ